MVIAGDGPERYNIEKLADKCETIKLMGLLNKEGVKDLMKIAQYLILASIFEPHGAVVREAYSWGLPVITSTEVGACEDLEPEKYGGYYFSPDNEDQLIKCLIDASKNEINEELKEEMRLRINKQETKKVVSDMLNYMRKEL